MVKSCNLELSLSSSSGLPDHHRSHYHPPMEGISESSPAPLTMSDNGRVAVCDVADFQVRAILLTACGGTERRMKRSRSVLMEPSIQYQQHSHNNYSVKKSLQRFLWSRKLRIKASSPYHH